MAQYIPMNACKEGMIYLIHSRNLICGIYNKGRFTGLRSKFGEEFLFPEDHWDSGPPYGTAKPIREIEYFGEYCPACGDNKKLTEVLERIHMEQGDELWEEIQKFCLEILDED